MTNRLELAWQRRRDIFDFVKLNPGCGVAAITGKFHKVDVETIRKAVYNLSALGYLIASGSSPRQFIYHAADVPFFTLADMKKRNVETALAASRKAQERFKPPKAEPEPWRTVHVSGNKRALDGTKLIDTPIPNQGGQGALKRAVTINCENY